MPDLVQTLRSLGKPNTAQIYRRHGAVGEVLGVSYAELGALRKKHQGDHRLAERLWTSGVHEARVLATQIADPAQVTRRQIEAWLEQVEGYPLTDALADFVSRTAVAEDCMTAWMKSKKEWEATAGWRLLTAAARREDATDAAWFEPYLKTIQKGIAQAPNRVRHAMNNALIAIGGRGGALEVKALAVAKSIGPVEVDHGDTDCETPDAAAYIAKLKARAKSKKARR